MKPNVKLIDVSVQCEASFRPICSLDGAHLKDSEGMHHLILALKLDLTCVLHHLLHTPCVVAIFFLRQHKHCTNCNPQQETTV